MVARDQVRSTGRQGKCGKIVIVRIVCQLGSGRRIRIDRGVGQEFEQLGRFVVRDIGLRTSGA